MSKLRDAAQQALEALESAIPWIVTDRNTFAEVVRARHFQREDTETDESILSGYDAVIDDAEKATTALRTALAEPEPRNQCGETCERAKLCAVCAGGLAEQEPVAWCDQYEGHIDGLRHYSDGGAREIPLYAAPQPVKQPLIADEICDSWEFITGHHNQIQFGPTLEGRYMYWSPDDVIEFARAIERAHGAIERAHGIGDHE